MVDVSYIHIFVFPYMSFLSTVADIYYFCLLCIFSFGSLSRFVRRVGMVPRLDIQNTSCLWT